VDDQPPLFGLVSRLAAPLAGFVGLAWIALAVYGLVWFNPILLGLLVVLPILIGFVLTLA
jgi:hypothetical protein